MTHLRHIDITQAEIDREIEWEQEAITKGIERYREALAENGIGNSNVGRSVMSRLMVPLVARVKQEQKLALACVGNPMEGRPANWHIPILALSPERLAAATLQTVFNANPAEGMMSYPVMPLTGAISRALHIQIDFENWEREQKKESKQTGEWTDLDSYLQLNRTVSAKTFSRFSNRIARARMEKWDEELAPFVGTKALDMLCEAKPDWFSVSLLLVSHRKTEYHLVLSEECQIHFLELIEKSEVTSPMLRPMLVPPRPWRREIPNH